MARTVTVKMPQMSLKAVRAFMEILEQDHPDARTELVFHNPFELLVSVVLSAQATDKSVNKATAPLFAAASTPYLMAALGEEGIAGYIRTIGLWRAKSRNIALLCQQLIERHNGEVPKSREELEALAGVGRKTANVVLNVAFGEPTMAVDTHIFRLGNRTGLAPGKTVRAVEDALLVRIPKDLLPNAHHCLILHGRYLCKARTPECWRCRAKELCLYKEKNLYPPHK
ncbi:endonuclease III [Acetobacteraceae bacterium ESL0709]|nr:endonuclease III [Acetobacteraceae bacterium ESL0697]MDF7677473.1 endonuclease III [Acetobacteraceae bacterium ESL0709]